MSNKRIILVLKISCVCLLFGRAWQHLFWDAPFRAFFWDEGLLKGTVEGFFGVAWGDYVTSTSGDAAIQGAIKATGVLYLLVGILVIYIRPTMKKIGAISLWLVSASLVVLAFLYCKEKFFHTGQFFEYASQFASPVFLYFVLFRKVNIRHFSVTVKIAIALTFICHGLYAYGYYPRPGNYVDMTLNILPISEPAAHTLLKIMGILDFIAAAALFIPKVQVPALIYTFVWATLTALARMLAHIDFNMFWASLHQWTFEVLIRVPHAALPLVLLIILEVKIPSLPYSRNKKSVLALPQK